MASKRTPMVGALAGVLAATGAVQARAEPPLTVFAAASLKNSLDAVDAAYAKATGRQVTASYAASSTLARQIEQGAPADVFVSADSDWMDDAEKHGAIAPGTRADILSNHLALIAPANSPVALHIAPHFGLAQALGRGRLAMAGAEVPAGRYGRQALTALGVWPQVEAKVVYGDSVRAALAFVDRGEAPLGVVYDTDAKVDPGVRIVDLFPDDTHPRIVYPAAATRSGQLKAAVDYLQFLEGPQAGAIFRRFGFTVLVQPR